jgi:hypothetical protein
MAKNVSAASKSRRHSVDMKDKTIRVPRAPSARGRVLLASLLCRRLVHPGPSRFRDAPVSDGAME